MKKKQPKIKQLRIKTEKAKCWKAFSEYIRSRDCLRSTGTLHSGMCITCGSKFIFQSLQAGHWIPGHHNAVLFDERNCHAQCMRCNVYLKGNPIKYMEFMKKTYGTKVMEELQALDETTVQYKAIDYKELGEYYKRKAEELK